MQKWLSFLLVILSVVMIHSLFGLEKSPEMEKKTIQTGRRRLQSLSYTFKSEIENVFAGKNFDEMFHIEGTKHPLIVKEHLGKNISLESLVLLNKIIGFKNNFDKKLDDPVWKFLSMRMSKYDSFLHIDVIKYRKILKSIVV